MVLDELLHVVLREIISLDVGLHELLVGDGSQVRQLLQLHEELLEVQLHQRAALVAALLHVSVAAGQRQAAVISIFSSRRAASARRHTFVTFSHRHLFISVIRQRGAEYLDPFKGQHVSVLGF